MIFHAFLCNLGLVHNICDQVRFFMVPIFFVISGFLFHDRSVREFLETRTKRILIPYFIAEILTTLLFLIIFPNSAKRPENYLLRIFDSTLSHSLADYPLWFLPCLFVAELIFLLIMKKFQITRQRILVSMLISFTGIDLKFYNIYLPWGIDIAMASQIFLITGFFLRDWIDRISTWQIILIVLILIPTTESNFTIDMPTRIYHTPILFFLDGIFGSILIFKLSQLISNKFLNFVGRQTLSILILHVPIFYILEISGLDPTLTIDCWIKILLTIFLILVIGGKLISNMSMYI